MTAAAATLLPARIAEAFGAAVEAAGAFRGATAPNPAVGCVLLDRDGTLLAVAAHERAGAAHAEAAAIARCERDGTAARIDVVVVTLEPCNHWGRTPPCTDAILRTPARTVWIGVPDPDPHVAGGGAGRLRETLAVHLLQEATGAGATACLAACRALIAPFAKQRRTGRPWVTVKQVLDRNGSMIPPPGRKTFSSETSLDLAHRLRRRADALLTGSGTVLADAPSFTVRRVPDHPGKRRHLVILDRRGRVPRAAWEAFERSGFISLPARDAEEALDLLGRTGALEVLVEAGPALTASLVGADLWDEHVVIRQRGPGEPDAVEVVNRHERCRHGREVGLAATKMEGSEGHVADR